MAAQKNMVTITLEEYKELLLKEKPTNADTELLRRMIDIFKSHLTYTDSDYASNLVMDNVKVNDVYKAWKDVFQLIRYVDFQLYMTMWNEVMTAERERKAAVELSKQMLAAKELRASQDD